jgi:ATP-dependent HslUV protease ATP-binding subunit HslU
MERLLDEVSFEAPDRSGEPENVDGEYVRRVLSDIVKDQDLSRYVL